MAQVAKAATVLGSLVATSTALTASSDLMKVFIALQDPTFTEYSIERLGDTDLVFTAAVVA